MNINFSKSIFILIIGFFLIAPFKGTAQSYNKATPIIVNGEETELEEVLSRYIQFKSISGSEKEAGEFIKQICLENELFVTQMGDVNGNFNFAASLKKLSDSLPNIIFLNHIDVVPPGDIEKWEHPPFSGEIIDNEVWGRGAYDNKGAAIMQLASVIGLKKQFKNKDIPYNVTFLAVSCEETQCDGGVSYVVGNYFDQLNAAIVIGEGPPEIEGVIKSNSKEKVFGISVAHKRPLWLRLELSVKTSGHSSITPLEYANKEMILALNSLLKKKQKAHFNKLNIDLLKQLGALEKGMYGVALRHPKLFKPLIVSQLRKQPEMFSIFSNTITITSIDSNNSAVNLVPNSATVLLDCRLLPFQSEDDFLKDVKKRLKNSKIQITVLNSLPMMGAETNYADFYDKFKNAIQEYYPKSNVIKVLMPNFNDVGAFRLKGVPGLSSIPIEIPKDYLHSIHNHNERIPVAALTQGKDVYISFVKKCFQELITLGNN